jgi:Domain of unknown function (DUF1924)
MTGRRFARLAWLGALLAAGIASPVCAAAVDELLKRYATEGAGNFSAAEGEQFWDRAVIDAKTGEPRKCSLCHTTDLRRTGKHAKTGKVIEPMAPSVNPKRLTDVKDIEKWFGRNCKWTLGRECTPQEKGNVLVMIRGR